MKSKHPVRDHDEVKIPNGLFVEPYSVVAGQVTSPTLLMPDGTTKRKLRYVRILLTQAANVTFKDGKGNQVTALPLLASVEYRFLVTEITVVSAGAVYIIHDGEIDLTQDLA